jgi:metallophosphoesterase (TIGR00282 family)
MNILYIGDIMAEPGINTVERVLQGLRQELAIDLVVAQSENVTEGRSIVATDMERLKNAGVDFFSGGNHTPERSDIRQLLEDPNQPIIGPANMETCPGNGYKYITTSNGPVLVISILGETFGRSPRPVITNPLLAIDTILDENTGKQRAATIVNFHGDFSSEKMVFGQYLDGRVTAVIGDHWHVQTADARVLPKGTAHISDVGMCGSLDSSLGVKSENIIVRWRDGIQNKNDLETEGTMQFCAVLVETNSEGLAKSITSIKKYI